MFFEVRVYKPDGQLKKMISSSELSQSHWKQFEIIEGGINLNNTGVKPVPAWVKRKLDLEFPSNQGLNFQSS